ncbi:FAD-dependent oxidoreductase, partial [Escherichia coli]|uniref:FAD-dependent oxidoreductase n=1 Tax=Escherichia coli TaxID=562 RepID=UPI0032E454EF
RFSKAGALHTKEFCQEHGIPFDEPGKLLVATTALELERLDALEERAGIHGLECERIDQSELRRREPNVSGLGALFIPSTGIVDYRAVARKLAELVTAAGGQVLTGARVTTIAEHPDRVDVGTADGGRYPCGQLVACAGLQSDRIAELAGMDIDVQIIPFRGEYFALPAALSGYVRHLIYPVPDPALPFLGVHLTPTTDG